MARDPARDSNPLPRRTKRLPARPSLEHLKKEAKRRLAAMRQQGPDVALAAAQLAVARDYGFASWRRLKAHVDATELGRRYLRPVFDAARTGDVETVRGALAAGFDPRTIDDDGRTIHQIAKAGGFSAIELLAREHQERDRRPPEIGHAINAILDAAEHGRADELARLLDDHPELIDERGGNFQNQTALHKAAWQNRSACVRLLIERGADVRIRDDGDNAYALHFAAESADLDIVRLLVEAGSDVIGEGDDHHLGVLGWATCLRQLRQDVAAYLLAHGARLNLWSAIALDRADEVRRLVARDRTVLDARMSRNEHHRTPLHHAAAKNRPDMVALLLDLGQNPNATDAAGATPLTTASQENADPRLIEMLLQAGAKIDFFAALNLARFDLAEAMLREDPARISAQGRDTVALHLAVARRNLQSVRWLIAHGVDVNAKRLLWDCNQTALHVTAEHGAVEVARLLLDAGADPSIHDDKYDASAIGWAEFCGQHALVQLLRDATGHV
jgi:ankyrin repeat protein